MNPAILCGWNQSPLPKVWPMSRASSSVAIKNNFFARLLEDSVQAVIRAAELTWSGEAPSAFYGFEVLCRMRAETGLGCAVVMASFMEGEWLRRRFPILVFQSHIRWCACPRGRRFCGKRR
jgi:hypothetical protein